MATVSLEHVSKVYASGSRAVSDISLDVADGEFLVLVGPSGCGKTTALRMVAGLEDISEGTVRVGGKIVNDLSPRQRDIAMVFQNYALYPHMTVAENIGFALSMRKLDKSEIRRKVEQAARILGLTEHLNRKPAQLSGGQRQRVAMGRAIVREPAAFLMDEPLSNLDAKLRVQMRAEISRIQRRLGVATFYVTHDQTEAMTMGDRVAVLRAGELQQCAAPQVLYDSPVNMFVAAFIGSPSMTLYEARVSEDGATVRLGSQELALPAARAREIALRGRDIVVGIRPENFHDAALLEGDRADNTTLVGDVELVEALGSERLVHFRIDAQRVQAVDAISARDPGEESLAQGELGAATLSEGVARVDAQSKIAAGGRATLAVDVEALHLFDPESGEAIGSPTA
ncbi:MAG: ABC transporter ATP-binding protein [Mycobacteriales bacterium]